MKNKRKNNGSIMLITVFVVVLLSAAVIGILEMNTEEIQIMQNQIYAVQALLTAQAGLNATFAKIRDDAEWDKGFQDKAFNGGFYSADVTGSLPSLTISSRGTTSQGFVAGVEADVTVDTDDTDHTIRIDNLRINE